MNLSWSNRVIKYVLFIFNLLFVISGIIMIAVGVSVKAYYTDYDIFLNNNYFSLPNLLIAIGSLIFFISFFGCCGAIRESWFMIFVFSILLSIIFIMEFSAGIAGYVLRDNTASYLEDTLMSTMDKYVFNNETNPTTDMWDTIQATFKCCGAAGPLDWVGKYKTTTQTEPVTPTSSEKTSPVTTPTTKSSSTSPNLTAESPTTTSFLTTLSAEPTPTIPVKQVSPNVETRTKRAADLPVNPQYDLPFSCCQLNKGIIAKAYCNLKDNQTSTVYTEGCVDGFGDYLKEHAVTLGGVGIAIALIQLCGVIFACHLARQLKHGFYST